MKLLKPTWVNHNGECVLGSQEGEPEVGSEPGLGLGSHIGPARFAPARCQVPVLRNRQGRTLSSAPRSRHSQARALRGRPRNLSSPRALMRAPRCPLHAVHEGAEAQLLVAGLDASQNLPPISNPPGCTQMALGVKPGQCLSCRLLLGGEDLDLQEGQLMPLLLESELVTVPPLGRL